MGLFLALLKEVPVDGGLDTSIVVLKLRSHSLNICCDSIRVPLAGCACLMQGLTLIPRLQHCDLPDHCWKIVMLQSSGKPKCNIAEHIHRGSDICCVRLLRVFYLDTLKRQLPRITEGGSLASVLEHCMYCGMSLGRVGLDFRGLLVPVFEQEVLRLFSSSVKVCLRCLRALVLSC